MSVIIPNMKMPKYTTKAEFGIDADGNPLCMVYHEDVNEPDIYDVVPLPEGHGRLIDADALMEIIRAHDYPLTAHFNSTDNGMFTLGIQQAVDEVTTIVPAEGGVGYEQPG